MADDAAGKDAKNAGAKANADTEKAESASDETAEAVVEDLDDSADSEDISLEPDEPEKGPKRMQGRHWAWTAAAVAVIAIAAGAAVIGRLYEEQRIEKTSSREALTAAQEFAGVLTNVDSAKLDENYSKTMDGSTGKFKGMYDESSAQLRRLLVEYKANSRGVVVDSAVKSATPNKVEVLLFIDQSVSNVSVPDGRMDRSRVQITMEKVGGRWLASDVALT